MTPKRLALSGLVLLLAAIVTWLVLWLAPSNEYIFLPDVAHPVAPLVMVAGGHPPGDGGGIYFVDVIVRKASLLEKIWPGIRDGSTLVPASEVQPPGVDESQQHREDLRAMVRSQSVAGAVALRRLGYHVVAKQTGALVTGVGSGFPAAGKLFPSDVVIAAGGRPVRTPADLRRLIARAGAGQPLALRVRHAGGIRTVTVKPVAHGGGHPIIGVEVEQAAQIRLPIKVSIDTGNVGGPSAGLAFALDVTEELGHDVDHGLKVAATGEIALDGSVLPIGGVEQKTIGVRKSGITVFLVPAGDNAREARRYAHGVRIVPVTSFQQALHALATIEKAGAHT